MSVVGAFALYLLRRAKGKETGAGQFLNDGGAVTSLIVLLCIGFDMIRPTEEIAELVNDNAILAIWAVFYAALMVALNLKESVWPRPGKKPA